MERTVNTLMAQLAADYADLPAVQDYLTAVRKDMIENGELFRQAESEDSHTPSPDDPPFIRYRVNLLVDNAELHGAPVIHEDNLCYLNLIGRIEHVARMGTLSTDFSLIKAVGPCTAPTAYLILDALRLLANPFAWDCLKRVLRAGEIRIELLSGSRAWAGTTSSNLEPIPVEVKVILVGERLLYYLLDAYDPDSAQLFKVAADFAEDLPRHAGETGNPGPWLPASRPRKMKTGDQTVPGPARPATALGTTGSGRGRTTGWGRPGPSMPASIATLQRQERSATPKSRRRGRVIEQAARRAADGERLSIHLGSVLYLLREADHLARRERLERIDTLLQIAGAIAARRRRLGQMRERLQGGDPARHPLHRHPGRPAWSGQRPLGHGPRRPGLRRPHPHQRHRPPGPRRGGRHPARWSRPGPSTPRASSSSPPTWAAATPASPCASPPAHRADLWPGKATAPRWRSFAPALRHRRHPQAGSWPSPARSTSTARSRPSAASTKRSRASSPSARPGV